MKKGKGKAIEAAAVILLIVGIIGSFVLAVKLGLDKYGDLTIAFVPIVLGGILDSIAIFLLISGFGELVENVAKTGEIVSLIAERINKESSNLDIIESLFERGLITGEEYQRMSQKYLENQ